MKVSKQSFGPPHATADVKAGLIQPTFKNGNRSAWVLSSVVARQTAWKKLAVKIDKQRAAPCICRCKLICRWQDALQEAVNCPTALLGLAFYTGHNQQDGANAKVIINANARTLRFMVKPPSPPNSMIFASRGVASRGGTCSSRRQQSSLQLSCFVTKVPEKTMKSFG